ncbi:cargo transport protein [Chrysochromulina tobinii]|uniref:Cargo transport protein n=1 Tax=Chrysochromulina tobinii TaxID=1460289 RepID=A0A0M0J9Y1_9EUKA|nr:cargo transport protein [Chrysochromulina tobinii]|eukprot:KOO23300.1 cargo transport protein [Chrysochromulina sp. CCMP291]
MMRQRQCPSLCSPLLLLLCSLASAAAFGFSVEPQTTECFEERVKVSDHVLGQWGLVLLLGLENPDGDAAPDITGFTVKVTSPQGDKVYHMEDEPSGFFDFTASVEGEYFICFTNGRTNREDVTLKITVNEPPDLIKLAKTEHLSPIEERIKNLHEAMNMVRDVQDEIREHDAAQLKMTHSTRTWLLYFTLIEAAVLVGVTVWQNLYLKSFFEVKRVI